MRSPPAALPKACDSLDTLPGPLPAPVHPVPVGRMGTHKIFKIARQGLDIPLDATVCPVAAQRVLGMNREHAPITFTMNKYRDERDPGFAGYDRRRLVGPCFSAKELYQGTIVFKNVLISQHPDDTIIFDDSEDLFQGGPVIDHLTAMAHPHFFYDGIQIRIVLVAHNRICIFIEQLFKGQGHQLPVAAVASYKNESFVLLSGPLEIFTPNDFDRINQDVALAVIQSAHLHK